MTYVCVLLQCVKRQGTDYVELRNGDTLDTDAMTHVTDVCGLDSAPAPAAVQKHRRSTRLQRPVLQLGHLRLQAPVQRRADDQRHGRVHKAVIAHANTREQYTTRIFVVRTDGIGRMETPAFRARASTLRLQSTTDRNNDNNAVQIIPHETVSMK
ncbi:hypothetical protein LSAT2_001039 [Lamellibrachia satsuma]|nr:hypothetical protein LSAT2_001039 [Lamellibrachia satsuma]